MDIIFAMSVLSSEASDYVNAYNFTTFGTYSSLIRRSVAESITVNTGGTLFAFIDSISECDIEINVNETSEGVSTDIDCGKFILYEGKYVIINNGGSALKAEFWYLPSGFCGNTNFYIASPDLLDVSLGAPDLDESVCIFEPNQDNTSELDASFQGISGATAVSLVSGFEGENATEIGRIESNTSARFNFNVPFVMRIVTNESADISLSFSFSGQRSSVWAEECIFGRVDGFQRGEFISNQIIGFTSSATCPLFDPSSSSSITWIVFGAMLIVVTTVIIPYILLRFAARSKAVDLESGDNSNESPLEIRSETSSGKPTPLSESPDIRK